MLFSSIPFLYYFLPLVLITYFLAPNRLKNTVLLLYSLVFYGWGEPKLLGLMLFTIGMFYLCGLLIDRTETRKKFWLWVSVAVSLGLLGIFKYADFFISSFNAVTGLGVPLLRLALPVGISFYTFQALSYTIEVYRGNGPKESHFLWRLCHPVSPAYCRPHCALRGCGPGAGGAHHQFGAGGAGPKAVSGGPGEKGHPGG